MLALKAGYGEPFSGNLIVIVAVVVTLIVGPMLIGRTAAVGTAGADVVGGLTTEKMGVSKGPGTRSGLAVIVAITAVELTVTTLEMYMVRLLLFHLGRCRDLCWEV